MTLAARNPPIQDSPRSALADAIRAFPTDRPARGLRPGTVSLYAHKLDISERYLADRGVTSVGAITASLLRALPLELGGAHAPGGVHAVFRAVKAFLRWWGVEAEPEGWRDPLATEPLDRDDLRRRGQVGPKKALWGPSR